MDTLLRLGGHWMRTQTIIMGKSAQLTASRCNVRMLTFQIQGAHRCLCGRVLQLHLFDVARGFTGATFGYRDSRGHKFDCVQWHGHLAGARTRPGI
jgi:hypothetical protein